MVPWRNLACLLTGTGAAGGGAPWPVEYCGTVKFKTAERDTVAPRYVEQLQGSHVRNNQNAKYGENAPAAQSRAAHELDIEDDVDEVGLDAHHDALGRERDAARLRDRDDAVAEREGLVAQTAGCVSGLEDARARDAADARLLDLVERLGGRELVLEALDELDGVLLEQRQRQHGRHTRRRRTDLIELLRVERHLLEVANALLLNPGRELLHALGDGVTAEEVGGASKVYAGGVVLA